MSVRRFARAVATATTAFVLVSCADKTVAPIADRGTVVALRIEAGIAAQASLARTIKVFVGYERAGGERVALTDVEMAVTAATQDVSVPVDIATCIADRSRAGSSSGCTLHVAVVLRDANAVTLDSALVSPFDATLGGGRDPIAVTVAAISTLTVPDSGIVAMTDTFRIQPVIRDAAGNALQRAVTYASSNQSIATVSTTGVVTGVAIGVVRISATSGGKSDTTDVEVAFGWKSLSLTSDGNGPFGTCGIGLDNRGYCWGANASGQVGNGLTNTALIPTAVAGLPSVSQISAGAGYACAITVAGAALCWGSNAGGNFGDSSTTSSLTPVPAGKGVTLRSISTGVGGTCGIGLADAAYCWGSGALGTGALFTANSTFPLVVSGGIQWAEVTGRSFNTHRCGLSKTGQAFCWGSTLFGGVGDGSLPGAPALLVPTAVSGGLTFSAIRIGGNNTCGVTTGGDAYCWGSPFPSPNSAGSPVPVLVAGGLTFKDIGVSTPNACALTASGQAFCWGVGNGLGTGGAVDSPTPVPVAGTLTFSKIYGGSRHTCAITTARIAYCWGSGTLGDGTTTLRLLPTRISNP